jgi:hypothetical protein
MLSSGALSSLGLGGVLITLGYSATRCRKMTTILASLPRHGNTFAISIA